MFFEKVNKEDPMGPLVLVYTFPIIKKTGNGISAAIKEKCYSKPKHLPKVGHGRKELTAIGLRSESNRRRQPATVDAFTPEWMQFSTFTERVDGKRSMR